eukprot:gi/632989877/ref/XP_007883883.1/ PREDICTED: interferon omega-1-like [Callorhinchus milii]
MAVHYQCGLSLFAMLCVSLTLGCSTLRLQKILIATTLNTLDEMGGHVPRHCVAVGAELRIASPDLRLLLQPLQNNDRILLLHKTFQHLNKIFHKNMKSVTWDLTQVNHFRELLVTQRDVVKDCIQDSASDSMLSALSTIHTYFRKLKKFLKQQRYSACAWEVIRMETRARLQQILILTARMTKGN